MFRLFEYDPVVVDGKLVGENYWLNVGTAETRKQFNRLLLKGMKKRKVVAKKPTRFEEFVAKIYWKMEEVYYRDDA